MRGAVEIFPFVNVDPIFVETVELEEKIEFPKQLQKHEKKININKLMENCDKKLEDLTINIEEKVEEKVEEKDPSEEQAEETNDEQEETQAPKKKSSKEDDSDE